MSIQFNSLQAQLQVIEEELKQQGKKQPEGEIPQKIKNIVSDIFSANGLSEEERHALAERTKKLYSEPVEGLDASEEQDVEVIFSKNSKVTLDKSQLSALSIFKTVFENDPGVNKISSNIKGITSETQGVPAKKI